MAMTLRQKMSWQVGTTLLGLLLVSGAALWGIDAVHHDNSVALEGYQRLRQAYVAGTHLQTAQKLLLWPHPRSVETARAEVQAAVTDFGSLSKPSPGWDAQAAGEVHESLQVIAGNLELLERSPGILPAEAVETQRDALLVQLGTIAQLSSGIRQATESAQTAAATKRQATFAVVGGLCTAVVSCAIILSVLHYRGVMKPIRRLSQGVHRLTAGQFKDRIEIHGRDELASLAADFNHMAAELDSFYHELERKVAEKSKELIRSERLASVGYLAAGVAHEINNPLSIISGYAEYALAELQKLDARAAASTSLSAGDDEVAKSLQVIRDEAFRCKEITEKLLSLARGGDDGRQSISLLQTARDVASIVGGLKEHRQKRLIVRTESADTADGDELLVSAIESEMKQVILNLTVNALEAVKPEAGEVRINLRRVGESVELSITDNGRGMSPVTLERVFEPFFTEKRGRAEDGRHGTGLGLSITHAIVRNHGGTIVAESDGTGLGSRFTVRLPAVVTTTV